MTQLAFADGTVEVDATLVATGLEIAPTLLLERLREGRITSVFEKGIDGDEGRYRLTFLSDDRRFRLVVDESGHILQRSAINVGRRHAPAASPVVHPAPSCTGKTAPSAK